MRAKIWNIRVGNEDDLYDAKMDKLWVNKGWIKGTLADITCVGLWSTHLSHPCDLERRCLRFTTAGPWGKGVQWYSKIITLALKLWGELLKQYTFGILVIKLHEHMTYDNSDQLTARSLSGCCEVLRFGSELVRGWRPGVAAGVSDSVEERGVPLLPSSSSISFSALTWVRYILDWWRKQSVVKCCD